MQALLRNPLYCLVSRLWWVPVLVGTAIVAVGGPHLMQAALLLAGLGVGFLAAATAAAWLHARRERRRAREYAADERHRFLCPECLRFSDPAYACGACGKEIEAFVLDTGGGYVNDCGHCGATLLPLEREGAVGLRAYCRHCRAAVERHPYHERRVCVIGVPSQADRAHFPQADTPERSATATAEALQLDDRSWLTYVLDLDHLAGRLTAHTHAAHHLDALWLDGRDANALELGEQLDRFIRRSRLPVAERKRLRIYVGCSREALPREVYNVLEGRFPNPGRLEFGISPETLVERLTTLRDEEAGREPARVLAVLGHADWDAMRAVKDPYGSPLLNPQGWFRSPGVPAVRLYNQEALRPEEHGCIALLAGLEAVWLSRPDHQTGVLDRLERLIQAADLTGQQQLDLVICIRETHLSAPFREALQSRFRVVRSGVSAEEFLRYGRGAGAPALLDWPTQVLATCLPGDFEALFREMGKLQRERLTTAWAVEETGNRTSFAVDLSVPHAHAGSFGETPTLSEVQAVWLGEMLPEPLELAEQLDRLIRDIWGSEGRRSGLVACVWSASPEPVLRNLLEARFGTVRYGVSAREFLEHGAQCPDRARLSGENAPASEPAQVQLGRNR